MKLTFCLLLGLIISTAFAGDKEFKAALSLSLEYEPAYQTEDYQQKAEQFVELSEQYPQEWLPIYYAAYNYIFAAEYSSNPNNKIKLLQEAEEKIQHAFTISDDNSELRALQAFLLIKQHSAKELDNENLSSEIQTAINKAKNLDAKNPRAFLISGLYLFYSDSEQAEQELKTALKLYQKASKPLHPSWGKEMAAAMSKKVK